MLNTTLERHDLHGRLDQKWHELDERTRAARVLDAECNDLSKTLREREYAGRAARIQWLAVGRLYKEIAHIRAELNG